MEQEKFELQKKHTDNIQELLEDTNQRLAKMEAEYVTQARATVSAHSTVQTDLDDVHFASPPSHFLSRPPFLSSHLVIVTRVAETWLEQRAHCVLVNKQRHQ